MEKTDRDSEKDNGPGKVYIYLIIAFMIFAYLVIYLKLMFF
jgi:hypothetical protein